MRSALLLTILATTVGGAAASPRVAAPDVANHRGERVTLVDIVSAVEVRPDGTILTFGSDDQISVRVPDAARARLRGDLQALRGRTVELTGTVTAPGKPLELVIERPEQLASQLPTSGVDELQFLRERVRTLEQQLARLRARVPNDGQTGVLYGPTPRALTPLPEYAAETTVLAERGVPTRIEWGPKGRVLYYGRERWTFDDKGQLVSVQRDK